MRGLQSQRNVPQGLQGTQAEDPMDRTIDEALACPVAFDDELEKGMYCTTLRGPACDVAGFQ